MIDFTDPEEARRWRAVDDRVMGGRSSSGLAATEEGTSAFAGEVSLADGGGFASVRSEGPEVDLAGARELVLRCRGDGRTYELRLRTRTAGVFYQADFDTPPGEWVERRFAPSDFEPVRRGQPVPNAPALDLDEVWSVGLLISDRQAGPFRLELRSLAARG